MSTAIPEHRRKIYSVLGSSRLDIKIRKLQPGILVFGCIQVNGSIELDRIRYLNNACASPREPQTEGKDLVCILESAAVQCLSKGGGSCANI
ncbi:MAG: hypothetical protein CMD92_06625 [Gammaproteobacteria bacterium]|nr:hypothetical protein [Gammaproteobacteria bacterium]